MKASFAFLGALSDCTAKLVHFLKAFLLVARLAICTMSGGPFCDVAKSRSLDRGITVCCLVRSRRTHPVSLRLARSVHRSRFYTARVAVPSASSKLPEIGTHVGALDTCTTRVDCRPPGLRGLDALFASRHAYCIRLPVRIPAAQSAGVLTDCTHLFGGTIEAGISRRSGDGRGLYRRAPLAFGVRVCAHALHRLLVAGIATIASVAPRSARPHVFGHAMTRFERGKSIHTRAQRER